ncbi:MAG TPA: zinc-dependent metalloprotease [Gemmataceae bacterium]|nr:zinc-dependent metalloprotease [Gemmataceae bacterium]
MKRTLLATLPLAVLTFTLFGHAEPADHVHNDSSKKFDDFDKTVKGAKQYDGLFRLFHKEEHLYAEIRPDQLDKPFLCPIAIARGAGKGGYTLNFDEQWVLVFKRVGDKVHLIRRNVHFKAKEGSPAAHAVETTYADSVLMALRIKSINPNRQSLLLDFNDIFMTDFAELHMGSFDSNRSTWHKIKAFPRNIELEVSATFDGSHSFFGDDSVIDSRGKTVVIHYGLCQLPEHGYHPRLADDRVGYFLSAVKDFSSDNADTAFLRYVNRWRLERAEPVDSKHPNKLSAPKKKIVFWIENSVPDEYRAAVREGILEWNKAFEKVGFRDAIEVRQQEHEDFDPEDINYNTFRWITTDQGFAMGPSRANPLTGEIIDADIIFDASMVRFWREDAKLFRGAGAPASLIQATRQGWGLFDALPPGQRAQALAEGWNDPKKSEQNRLRARVLATRQGLCQCGAHMRYELGMAAMALAAKGENKPDEKIPEELIQQAVKEVTMHEVGHTLGLRHNFKSSTMLKNEQLHDTNITRKTGLTGSVMDYAPINLAPKGVKQGDYFSTTIGPYDYWAIAYAYKPLSGGTEGELEKLKEIAKESAKHGHDYATDEDMFGTSDPLVNVWDLGADPMKFAQERILLAEQLLKGLEDRVVDKGEGYQRARLAFNVLLMQFGNGAHLVANFIGGEQMHRDHRDDPHARDPFVPVKGDKQREALKFLQEHILSDQHFQFSPRLLRHLGADRWMHWGNEGAAMSSVDYPLYQRILRIQRIVLGQVFNPAVLSRIQNNALKADKEEKPLTIAEVFRSATDGVWTEGADKNKEGKRSISSSVIRRNLQREHLKNLFALILGQQQRNDSFFSFVFGSASSTPPDARSLARMHLRDISKRIDAILGDKQAVVEDTTRAHLEECRERIGKVLNASMQVNEP